MDPSFPNERQSYKNRESGKTKPRNYGTDIFYEVWQDITEQGLVVVR